MKTPKEVFRDHYQKAEPQLDQLRHRLIQSMADKAPSQNARLHPLFPRFLASFSQKIIFPWKHGWIGLAMAWTIIFTLNFLERPPSEAQASDHRQPAPEVARLLREQKLLLTEILPGAKADSAVPTPQSRRPLQRKMVYV